MDTVQQKQRLLDPKEHTNYTWARHNTELQRGNTRRWRHRRPDLRVRAGLWSSSFGGTTELTFRRVCFEKNNDIFQQTVIEHKQRANA